MKTVFTEAEKIAARAVLASPFLKDFTAEHADRLKVLVQFLQANAVPHRVVKIRGYRHCVVRFRDEAYTADKGAKILVAHYDRSSRFGANDNSAACAQLAFFAKDLAGETIPHNIRIIFTDGEELAQKSLAEQGAFFLGLGLRKISKAKEEKEPAIFVFDMCGTGDVLVFSQAGLVMRDAANLDGIKRLQAQAIGTAQASGLPVANLPTGFSDNAGLLASGLTAQLITVLPRAEAAAFYERLKKLKASLPMEKFQRLIKEGVIEGHANAHENPEINRILPATWQRMHTDTDTLAHLNWEAFALMRKYFTALQSLAL